MTDLARPSATASCFKTSRKRLVAPSDAAAYPHGLLESCADAPRVVVKCGPPEEIQREWAIATALRGFPNVAKYYSALGGYLAMPHFALGSLMAYRWDRANLEVLKAAAKQACFAMLHAFEARGAVHGNLHPGNVMLRPTRKLRVAYGAREVATEGIYAVLVDFDRADTRDTQPREIYDDLRRLLSPGLVMLENTNLILYADTAPLARLILENAPVTDAVYQTVSDVIGNIMILLERINGAAQAI